MVCAGTISVYASLNLSYFPAQAYVNPLFRYGSLFAILFLSIAVLESARSLKSRTQNKKYFAAQSFIDLTLVILVGSAAFVGTMETVTDRTVNFGNQSLVFSTLDYPVANEFKHGAIPLFQFDEGANIHSVYFDWGEETYDFENIFSDTWARSFFSGVHAPDSPNLKDIDFSGSYISMRDGHVYLHEGEYVLEFFPTSVLQRDKNLRFLQFIKDNAAQIRADFRPHLVPSLRN